METLPNKPGNLYKVYSVSGRGKQVSKLLDAVDEEYKRISLAKGVIEPPKYSRAD
jgi:hypothetical protein